MDNKVFSIAQSIADDVREYLRKAKLDASGTLSKSIVSYIELNGEDYQVWFDMEAYGKYLDQGRGPGKFPPPDDIKDWIRFKHIVPLAKSSQKVPSTNQLAYLIGRKISEEGTKATNFIDNSIAQPEVELKIEEIEGLIVEQFVKIINDEIDEL